MPAERAFAYLRISEDRHGDSISPEQQRHDLEGLAERKGYRIVEWFEDRDLSAYRRGVVRPEWESMLGRLPEVRGGGLFVWELERASRRLKIGAELLELLDDLDVRLMTYRNAMDSVESRDTVEIFMAISAGESRKISERVSRAHRYRTTVLGEHSHPRDRFGWRYDKITKTHTLHAEEAAVIRAMIDASQRGVGDVTIARGLNDGTLVGRVIPPRRADQWGSSQVKVLLNSPALAGFAIHRGAPATDEPTLPAVMSVEEWELFQEARRRRRRAGRRDRGTGERSALLLGLVRCDSCKSPMYRGSPPPNQVYACGQGNTGRLCPARASINAAWLEKQVVEWFFDKVRRDDEKTPPIDEGNDPTAEVRAQVARTERALLRLMDDHHLREAVPRDVFERKTAELGDELRVWRDKLEAIQRPRPRYSYPTVLQAWKRLGVAEQRELLSTLIAAVWVRPRTFWRQPPHKAQYRVEPHQNA